VDIPLTLLRRPLLVVHLRSRFHAGSVLPPETQRTLIMSITTEEEIGDGTPAPAHSCPCGAAVSFVLESVAFRSFRSRSNAF
jgi:hypothetical protein